MACSTNQSKQAPARVQFQHQAKIITAALKQQQHRKKIDGDNDNTILKTPQLPCVVSVPTGVNT